jgi:hypothetical protein
MKKQSKQRTVQVYLEPDVIEMIEHVCRVEGLTREQVLEACLERYRAEQKSAAA